MALTIRVSVCLITVAAALLAMMVVFLKDSVRKNYKCLMFFDKLLFMDPGCQCATVKTLKPSFEEELGI